MANLKMSSGSVRLFVSSSVKKKKKKKKKKKALDNDDDDDDDVEDAVKIQQDTMFHDNSKFAISSTIKAGMATLRLLWVLGTCDGFYVPKFKDEAERKDKEEKLDSYAKKRVEQWYSVYKVDPKYSAKDVLKMKYQIKGNRQYNQMIHSGAGDSDQIDKTAESKHDK
eukprot:jgi/Bigna1/145008/aug1.94_g19716